MIVIVSGGLTNILLGFVIFLIIVASTPQFATNVVQDVVPGSYIEEAGLRPGDKIIAVNGKGVSFYSDITLYAEDFRAGETGTVTVKRDREKHNISFKPSESVTSYTYTEDGITVKSSINGISESEEFYPYDDSIKKDGTKVGTTETATRLLIGFVPKLERVNALNIWGEAWNETKFVVKLVYTSLWQLVTGKVGMDQMSGPVGVVSVVNDAVHSGSRSWLYVLNLTALLTINLGVFNLLPIPALDGGRLLFLIIELVTRKKIPPEKEGIVHAIGFALLIALILFVSYNDILKLFAG